MSKVLVGCLMVLLGCRGLQSYEKATAQFGDATGAGVTATRGVVGAAHETCQMRAWSHAVGDRFQRASSADRTCSRSRRTFPGPKGAAL